MIPFDIDTVIDQVRSALEEERIADAVRMLEDLRAADQSDVVSDLEQEDRVALFPYLDPAQSADIVEELEDRDAAELIAQLPVEAAIQILDEMEPDEAADVLGDLPPEQAQAILEQLEDPEEVKPLLLYPDESAGGLMTSEFLVLRRRMTVAQAIQAVREWNPDTEAAYNLFVVDREGKLIGYVDLPQLLVARPGQRIEEIMDTDVIAVPAGTDREECAELMARYDLVALPVVDDRKAILGVITFDDVMDAVIEEATEDIQRLGGSLPLREPYLRSSIFSVAMKRIGWLLLLFITGSLTGTVLRIFESELRTVISLTIFVPLLIGTGGNSGSQATSTIIRAIALGDIDFKDGLKALWHELGVGIVLGIGMAAIGFGRAILWETGPDVALAVALALMAIVIWANMLGAILPIVADRIGIDPTVVSGPVMSTLVDATGLYIYFTIAKVVLGI
ncbi:MAG TPA: magnesium transporter [Chloroflexi bacterium]|nr:magnesium transporter [Chloroflexota bacterium]